jgi:hypothetical protein
MVKPVREMRKDLRESIHFGTSATLDLRCDPDGMEAA